MTIANLITDLGGRRFLLTVGAGLVDTWLLVCGYIDATIYRDLTIATVAAYIAGNCYQKHVEAKNDRT